MNATWPVNSNGLSLEGRLFLIAPENPVIRAQPDDAQPIRTEVPVPKLGQSAPSAPMDRPSERKHSNSIQINAREIDRQSFIEFRFRRASVSRAEHEGGQPSLYLLVTHQVPGIGCIGKRFSFRS